MIDTNPLNLNREQYSIFSKNDRGLRNVIRDRKKEPVTDHMLVCLPEDAGANGYSSIQHIGDLYILDPKCAHDEFNARAYQNRLQHFQIDGESHYIARIVDFQGKRTVVQLTNEFFQPTGSRVSYEKDSRCFVSRIGIEQGSQCLGSACVRETSGQGPCGALASCLDGLAAWANVWPLGNPASIQPTANDAYNGAYNNKHYYDSHNHYYDSLTLRKSSSGPRGGASTATPNGRPAGHARRRWQLPGAAPRFLAAVGSHGPSRAPACGTTKWRKRDGHLLRLWLVDRYFFGSFFLFWNILIFLWLDVSVCVFFVGVVSIPLVDLILPLALLQVFLITQVPVGAFPMIR